MINESCTCYLNLAGGPSRGKPPKPPAFSGVRMPTESPTLRLTRDGPMAVITLDNPPVNALRTDMLREIGEHVTALEKERALILILTGAGNNAFCAGADVEEMGTMDLAAGADIQPAGQAGMDRIEPRTEEHTS